MTMTAQALTATAMPTVSLDVDAEEDGNDDEAAVETEEEDDQEARVLPPGLEGTVAATQSLSPCIPIPTVDVSADSIISISFAHPPGSLQGLDGKDLELLCRPLPAESAGADIVIAADSSYVETSSAPCAIELKRRYDALYGVNVNVRSPYAITSFVGQHGQTRLRVSHRDMSAPGASAAQAEEIIVARNRSVLLDTGPELESGSSPSTSSPQPQPSSGSRTNRARASFKEKTKKIKAKSKSPPPTNPLSFDGDGGSSSTHLHHAQSQSFSRATGAKRHSDRKSRGRLSVGNTLNALIPGSGTPAGSPHPSGAGGSGGARKLKKPRSNPDFHASGYGYGASSGNGNKGGVGLGGRMHSHSVSNATDIPRNANDAQPHQMNGKASGDPFSVVMGWNPSLRLGGGASGVGGLNPQSSTTYGAGSSPYFFSHGVNGTAQGTPLHGSSTHSTPSMFFVDAQAQLKDEDSRGTGVGGFVAMPFGPGIRFQSPASSSSRSRSGSQVSSDGRFDSSDDYFGTSDSTSDFIKNGTTRHLREMQSFESGLTATPMPHSSSTLSAGSGIPTGSSPLSSPSAATRLEVDLGSDIDINISLGLEEIDFVDVGDLGSSSGQGAEKERVLARQPSAILLVDRDKERERERKEKESAIISISIPEKEESSASTSTSPSEAISPLASAATPSTTLPSDLTMNEPEPEPGPEPSTPRVQTQTYAPNPTLPPRLSKFATYSTEIFDVLQTSRGLPRLDLLDADTDSGATTGNGSDGGDTTDKPTANPAIEPVPVTVKMFLSQDESAAPKDDPRFVIWGELFPGVGTSIGGEWAGSSTSISLSDDHNNDRLSSTTSSVGVKGFKSPRAAGANASSTTSTTSTSSNHHYSVSGTSSHAGVGTGTSSTPSKPTLGSSTSTSSPPLSSTNMLTSMALKTMSPLGDEGEGPTRILLAATIERWLAQLTSDLDYDELLNFFLTYRTYVGALDLARLLIARFCWALGSASATKNRRNASISISDVDQDDITRRIVRVRTFVAFKYWLITFFTVDFVPNRELRLFVAASLNDIGKELAELSRGLREVNGEKFDPREVGISRGALVDGLSIIKKLKKVAKDCKKLYTHNNQATFSATDTPVHSPPAASSSSRKSVSLSSTSADDTNAETEGKEHLLGKKFAEATRKLSAAAASRSAANNALDADDSDVDLDFLPDDSVPSSSYTPVNLGASTLNFNLSNLSTVGLTLSPPGPGSIPLSSFSILQRTDHAPGPEGFFGSSAAAGATSANPTLHIPPHRHVLERVLVKTLGRLGRWKRVLNSGSMAHGVNIPRSMTTGGLGRSYAYGSSSGGGFNNVGLGLGTRVAAACTDVSAFDVELTVDSNDLLGLNSPGGVESYLRLVESQSQSKGKQAQIGTQGKTHMSVVSPSTVSTTLLAAEPATSKPTSSAPAVPIDSGSPETVSRRSSVVSSIDAAQRGLSDDAQRRISTTEIVSDYGVIPKRASIADTVSDYEAVQPSDIVRNRDSIADTVSDYGVVINGRFTQATRESRATRHSYRTSSSGSFGEPLSASRASAKFSAFTSPWSFNADELSDHSSDEHEHTGGNGAAVAPADGPAAPPGLRRRRLPLRRELEFEFLERPQTVSSMGIISRSSIVSASSASTSASRASSSSAAGGLGGGPIQQWQMNALKSDLTDDEEPGDVDEALKRLEGQINPAKQQEKASKVNGWVKTIRERLAAGDYSDEEPMYSDDEDEDDEDNEHEHERTSGQDNSLSPPGSPNTPLHSADSAAKIPVVAQTNQVVSPARSTEAKPALEDVVPLEILQSRVSSSDQLIPVTPERIPSVTSKFVDPANGPKAHRSFVLSFKTEELAQHFAMIDRELFMTVKFEELLLEDWMYCEEINTLDWASYLKDRARWKAESRWPEKTSALGAVRARFNLMVNFTISEIVLTSQADRPLVFSRFLRIAWKSYQRNSFNTLVAIMTGLESEWVMKAMRRSMHKLSIWDNRMLTDFRVFTSSQDSFKFIRTAVDAINDAKPLEATTSHTHAPSVGNTGPAGSSTNKTAAIPPACVPFIGTYLSQLYHYTQLPVLIDPTAPHEIVTIDALSSNLSTPSRPEVFNTLVPLPPSMHLEPLINVQRQRLIAGVIKSLVAGQHLASRVQFQIDKKLFNKCLRIRGLDESTLQRAFALALSGGVLS